jgi:hypothetical protein
VPKFRRSRKMFVEGQLQWFALDQSDLFCRWVSVDTCFRGRGAVATSLDNGGGWVEMLPHLAKNTFSHNFATVVPQNGRKHSATLLLLDLWLNVLTDLHYAPARVYAGINGASHFHSFACGNDIMWRPLRRCFDLDLWTFTGTQ